MGLRLTSYQGKMPKQAADKARTTLPGFLNRKGQEVIAATGAPSTSFRGQKIYRMKCRGCGSEYGSNGCDIHDRSCPHCQQGAAGEPLPERPQSLLFGDDPSDGPAGA